MMKGVRTIALVGALGFISCLGAGCVSRDEYLRESFGRRKAVERADALERELADERNRNMALEKEREALRGELDAKTAMADSLKSENERLDSFVKKLQAQMDNILDKGVGDVQVVEVKLPPELDRALQEFAAQYPNEIEYDPKLGLVRWKSDLTFAKGSDEVNASVKPSLEAFTKIVSSPSASPFEVVVVGHTDNLRIGPITGKKHPTNWHLSVHRAVAVMFELNRFGVSFGRLGCMGYGEHRPRVANPASGGAEANRRVEIFLVSGKESLGGTQAMYRNTNDGSVYAKMEEP